MRSNAFQKPLSHIADAFSVPVSISSMRNLDHAAAGQSVPLDAIGLTRYDLADNALVNHARPFS